MVQGKNDFKAINYVRNDEFFQQALGLENHMPTEACTCTRFEKEAEELIPLINQTNIDFLINRKVSITPLNTGHISLLEELRCSK